MLRTILSLVSAGILTLTLTACGGDEGSDRPVSLTASTTHLADLARNVGGDRVDVDTILSASSDPHEYEPAPGDATALTDADLVLQSGGELDEWLGELIEGSGTDAPVVTILDRIASGEEPDPHWWQDPRAALTATALIRDELTAVDPDGAEGYRSAAQRYSTRLKALDADIAACIERVPADRRKLVTSHDSLSPFADRYGLEVIGAAIPARTTQAQASAGSTADLVELIESEGVPAVFPEAGVSAEVEEAIAEEGGAVIGGELWTDALGPEGSDGATYLDAMRANASAIAAGLSDGEVTC